MQAPSPAGPSRGDPETSPRAPVAWPPRGWRQERGRGHRRSPHRSAPSGGATRAARAGPGDRGRCGWRTSLRRPVSPQVPPGSLHGKDRGTWRLWAPSLIPCLFTTRGNGHTSPRKVEASAAARVREHSVTGGGAGGPPIRRSRLTEPEQISLSAKCEKLNQTKGNNTRLVASFQPWVIMLKNRRII